MIFAILTLICALSISCIAAYFSIIGLATIFPGSIEAVIAMGAALEIGKIVAAIWLHKNWKLAPNTIKIYLFSAILVLMGITSMGIFGFLSKSHIEHQNQAEKNLALVSQVETKITREREFIDRQKELIQQAENSNQNLSDKSQENIKLEQQKIEQLNTQLEKDIALDSKMLLPIQSRIDELNKELNEVKNKPGGLFSNKKKEIEKITAEQSKEREELSAKKSDIESRVSKYRNETSSLISDIRQRIQEYQSIGFEKPDDIKNQIEEYNSKISLSLDKIDELEKEKFNYDDGSRQLEAEVGPIKYVAELISDFTGVEFDIGKAVRIVIIILIFVFDPLAVLLVLAAHISLTKHFPKLTASQELTFEKIAEIESQSKLLDQQEVEILERKKDLDHSKSILELNEAQVQKYQDEISKTKEALRLSKIEIEKRLLEQEDASVISSEVQQLINQKEAAQKEIQQIKISKNKILSKAEETIKSAKEIKTVLGNHQKNRAKIEQLKHEVCMNSEKFNSLKNGIIDLESSNKILRQNINSLKQENAALKQRKPIDPNPELKNKISQLIDQRNELVEQNKKAKNPDTVIARVNSFDNKIFELSIPSTVSGTHQYIKHENFSNEQIKLFIKLTSEIDQESSTREFNELSSIYNKKISTVVDPRISNREYNKLKPEYKFLP